MPKNDPSWPTEGVSKRLQKHRCFCLWPKKKNGLFKIYPTYVSILPTIFLDTVTLSLSRDLLTRLQLKVSSLPDDHLPKTLKSGLLKLTRWKNISHHSSPGLFQQGKLTFPRQNFTFTFPGTMRRLTSLEPEHVTAAKKYICDRRNTFVIEKIHLWQKKYICDGIDTFVTETMQNKWKCCTNS